MANIEKHPKHPMEQIEQADFSDVPTCARAAHLVGEYIRNHHNGSRTRLPGNENQAHPIILRFEDLPVTPGNLERIQERVRLLNRRLAASGTPFRLRVVR